MGKDQELLQAVKTEDLLTVQKLLQRPRPGKASKSILFILLQKDEITEGKTFYKNLSIDDFTRKVRFFPPHAIAGCFTIRRK